MYDLIFGVRVLYKKSELVNTCIKRVTYKRIIVEISDLSESSNK